MATSINTINIGGVDKQLEDTTARNNIVSEAARLDARIDNIIAPAGGAPSAEEVQDARIGVDNTIYPNLGTAIRTQIGNLSAKDNQVLTRTEQRIGAVNSRFYDFFDVANRFTFLDGGVLSVIEPLIVDKISNSVFYATNGNKNENTGFYLPFSLAPGNYKVKAIFSADGTNNVRIFSESQTELVRLTSGVEATFNVSKNSNYYLRLYYQAYNSYIRIDDIYIKKSGDITSIKRDMLGEIGTNIEKTLKLIGKKIGLVANNSDYISPGFLSNSGVINTSQSWAAYSLSKLISVDKGDTVYIPFTYTALSTQLGGYFKNGNWVAPLGDQSSVLADGYYKVSLDNSIDFDAIRVNMYNNGTNTDFSVFVNEKAPSTRNVLTLGNNVIENTAWTGKTWVALGDSWTEGVAINVCGRYTDKVSAILQMNCINLGVGGTGVAKFAEQDNKPLTQEIANSADLITIWGSINNMANNSAVCGTIDDAPSATGTLMAMWKYTIEKVLTLNPIARLVIIGCPISLHSSWRGYEPYNSNGDTIEHSVEMIGKLANHYGLPFVNMFQLSGFNSFNFGSSADNNFGYDKVHPSRKGVDRVSDILIGALKEIQPIV